MVFGVSESERESFDRDGFIVMENVLSREQLDGLIEVSDQLYAEYGGDDGSGRLEIRNAVAHHQLLLDLISHRLLLPVVVDLLGANIKMRSTHVDIRPPLARATIRNELGYDRMGEPEQWHVDGPIFGFPTVDNVLPLMEVKVGYYLTDVLSHDSGPLCVVPGSHKLDYRMLADARPPIDRVQHLVVAAGSAVVFRTGLWHCVSPNVSAHTRKVLYYAYTYRWIQPSDYLMQAPELLARCTPIQRQLLGGAGGERHPLGAEAAKRPESLYWFFDDADLPILPWFEHLPRRTAREL